MISKAFAFALRYLCHLWREAVEFVEPLSQGCTTIRFQEFHTLPPAVLSLSRLSKKNDCPFYPLIPSFFIPVILRFILGTYKSKELKYSDEPQ